MVKIYCIEDINDLKYVGSTTQLLRDRMKGHKADKYRRRNASSRQLHLEHSIIYLLEECPEDLRKERERYWIDKIDCVNLQKLDFDEKEWRREYMKKYNAKYYSENKEYFAEYHRKKLLK